MSCLFRFLWTVLRLSTWRSPCLFWGWRSRSSLPLAVKLRCWVLAFSAYLSAPVGAGEDTPGCISAGREIRCWVLISRHSSLLSVPGPGEMAGGGSFKRGAGWKIFPVVISADLFRSFCLFLVSSSAYYFKTIVLFPWLHCCIKYDYPNKTERNQTVLYYLNKNWKKVLWVWKIALVLVLCCCSVKDMALSLHLAQ